MYQLKVAKDSNYLKHIPLIRKCFPELSIGEIKRRIESGEVVAEQDPIPRWDPLDDLRGIDRVQMFCDLRTALVRLRCWKMANRSVKRCFRTASSC